MFAALHEADNVQVFGRRRPDLATRSAGRRPKSAKARNRVGRQREGGAAGERRSKKAMEIWSRDKASGGLGRLSEVEQGYNLDVPARMLLNRGARCPSCSL